MGEGGGRGWGEVDRGWGGVRGEVGRAGSERGEGIGGEKEAVKVQALVYDILPPTSAIED